MVEASVLVPRSEPKLFGPLSPIGFLLSQETTKFHPCFTNLSVRICNIPKFQLTDPISTNCKLIPKFPPSGTPLSFQGYLTLFNPVLHIHISFLVPALRYKSSAFLLDQVLCASVSLWVAVETGQPPSRDSCNLNLRVNIFFLRNYGVEPNYSLSTLELDHPRDSHLPHKTN